MSKSLSVISEAEYKLQEKDSTIAKVMSKLSHVRDAEHTLVKVAVLDSASNVEAKVYNITDVLIPASVRSSSNSKIKKITLSYDADATDEMTLKEFMEILKKFQDDPNQDASKILIQAEVSSAVREMNVVFFYDDETNVVFLCVGGYAKLPSVRQFVLRLKNAALTQDETTTVAGHSVADVTAVEPTPVEGPIQLHSHTYLGEYVPETGLENDETIIFTPFSKDDFKDYITSENERKIQILVGVGEAKEHGKIYSFKQDSLKNSFVESIAYNVALKRLCMALKTNRNTVKLYAYSDISPEVAFSFMTSENAGAFYHSNIRGRTTRFGSAEEFDLTSFAPSHEAPAADTPASNDDNTNTNQSAHTESVNYTEMNTKIKEILDADEDLSGTDCQFYPATGIRGIRHIIQTPYFLGFKLRGTGERLVGDEAKAFLNRAGYHDALAQITEFIKSKINSEFEIVIIFG